MKRRHPGNDSPWERAGRDRYSQWWTTIIVCSVVGGIFMVLIYAVIVNDQNDKREGQFKVVHALEATTHSHDPAVTVESVAKSLVIAHDRHFGASELDDKAFRERVVVAANVGVIPQPTVPKKTWDEFFPSDEHPWLGSWLGCWGFIVMALFSIGLTIPYAWESRANGEYLADLKLRKVKHVIFIVVTPLLWPSYVISAMFMRLASDRERQLAEARPRPVTRPSHLEPELSRSERFTHDPEAAFASYRKVRAQFLREALETKRSEARRHIGELDYKAEELSDQLQQTQRQRTAAKKAFGELNEAVHTADDELNEEALRAEFSRILALDSVQRVHATYDGITLLVTASYQYMGLTYDLGDWELDVRASGVSAYELRCSRREGWPTLKHPSYRIGSTSFCFGTIHDELNTRARKGFLLEAAVIAIRALNSVNVADRHKLPAAFHTIKSKGGGTDATATAVTAG